MTLIYGTIHYILISLKKSWHLQRFFCSINNFFCLEIKEKIRFCGQQTNLLIGVFMTDLKMLFRIRFRTAFILKCLTEYISFKSAWSDYLAIIVSNKFPYKLIIFEKKYTLLHIYPSRISLISKLAIFKLNENDFYWHTSKMHHDNALERESFCFVFRMFKFIQ